MNHVLESLKKSLQDNTGCSDLPRPTASRVNYYLNQVWCTTVIFGKSVDSRFYNLIANLTGREFRQEIKLPLKLIPIFLYYVKFPKLNVR